MEKEAALLESGKVNEDLCSFYEDELSLTQSCTEKYSITGTCYIKNLRDAIAGKNILCTDSILRFIWQETSMVELFSRSPDIHNDVSGMRQFYLPSEEELL